MVVATTVCPSSFAHTEICGRPSSILCVFRRKRASCCFLEYQAWLVVCVLAVLVVSVMIVAINRMGKEIQFYCQLQAYISRILVVSIRKIYPSLVNVLHQVESQREAAI